MNADAVAALREALHDRHLDSEANGCDHHADEYGESLQCRDEAEALLAHPSFAALAAAPLPSESHYECWFCKGQFVEDALIAGYDTFDEQRLACLACNERMQGNWRPHAAPLPSEPETTFAWLIERGQPERQVPTVWWWLAAGGREGWTEVASEAFRFESREAAEEIITAKFTPLARARYGGPSARAVEHGFHRGAPLPSDTPADGLDVERRRSMKKQGRSTFLLMSEFEQLEEWCRLVRTVFDGETPFLVGSVHSKPTFRDVDLRLILPDAAFDDAWRDPVKVRLMNRAISVWGQQETSLPIDFQIQRMTEANEQFGGEFRNPMGVRDWTAIPTSGIPRPDTDQEDRP